MIIMLVFNFIPNLINSDLMFLVRLGVSKVETNQDQYPDFLICQDLFLKPVKIFSTCLSKVLKSLGQDLDKNWDFRVIETVETLLRLGFWSVEIKSLDGGHVKTNWDPQA